MYPEMRVRVRANISLLCQMVLSSFLVALAGSTQHVSRRALTCQNSDPD